VCAQESVLCTVAYSLLCVACAAGHQLVSVLQRGKSYGAWLAVLHDVCQPDVRGGMNSYCSRPVGGLLCAGTVNVSDA